MGSIDIKAKLGLTNKLNSSKAKTEKAKTDTKHKTASMTDYIPKDYRYGKIALGNLVPADRSWNFFTEPSEDKIQNLAVSIYQNGLLQPIVVRALKDAEDKFEILAGHTRFAAYNLLLSLVDDDEKDKYTEIEAIIYDGEHNITDAEAQEIIVDTNFFQRGNLIPSDMAKCVKYKIKCLKANTKYGSGPVAKILAEQYGLERTTIQKWKAIADMDDNLSEIMDNGLISINNAYKLTRLTKEEQRLLAEQCGDKLNNQSILAAKITDTDTIQDIIAKINSYNPNRKIKKFYREYDLDNLKHKNDVPMLVFVSKKKQEEFLKWLSEQDDVYTIL